MTKEDLADAVLSRILDWPDAALNELFEAIAKIEAGHGLYYQLSPEESQGVERGLADAEAGRFATEEEVAEVFGKFAVKQD